MIPSRGALETQMGWSLGPTQAKKCNLSGTSCVLDRGRGSLLSHRGILPAGEAVFLIGNKCIYIEQLRRVEKGILLMSIPVLATPGAQDL